MNAVDGTDRSERKDDAPSPSLLTIILDTNPFAWSLLGTTLPLSKLLANLLVFINAHLAIGHANRVAVVASHTGRAEFLYPVPALSKPTSTPTTNGYSDENRDIDTDADEGGGDIIHTSDDANKYRPFAHVEKALLHSLQDLISTTTAKSLANATSTMIAGALTLALTHISKTTTPTSLPSNTTDSNNFTPIPLEPTEGRGPGAANARILVVSVSGDLANQYIPIMNALFACQRLHIPVDILKLAGDTVFLQQAADLTGGVYIAPSDAQKGGLLQYLMMGFLPDAVARNILVSPGEGEGVDFRAACFCHLRVVDIGFVCSICLSIFCEPLQDEMCLTCGTQLKMANYGMEPVVVPRRKKKKRKLGGPMDADRGEETPGSAVGTPG
ncbi:RNA polymerase II transcription factor B subunit 4 [Elasticomyces elasticus]|nr:RNA polymerase II transcription factor B subunit 4 [Elasticomyces elasticus]